MGIINFTDSQELKETEVNVPKLKLGTPLVIDKCSRFSSSALVYSISSAGYWKQPHNVTGGHNLAHHRVI